jgi:predicted Zn-dependent protease
VNLSSQTVSLTINSDQVINAFARPNGNVQINLALSELVSDSPSEIAFAVGHELGHIAQYQRGLTTTGLLLANREQDADLIGLSFLLGTGYDPYAGAGLLGKLYTATGQAGLVASAFDDLTDPHGSFNTRADTMFTILSLACTQPSAAAACAQYKSVVHPNFPPSAPLFRRSDVHDSAEPER